MHYLALLVPILIISRAVAVLRIGIVWKILLSLIVLAAALKFPIIYYLGGKMFFAPDLPAAILIFANWIYAAMIIFFLLLAVSEFFLLFWKMFYWISKHPLPANFRTSNNFFNLALLVAGMIFSTFMLYSGLRQPMVKELLVTSSQIPPAADNMRIVMLTDLHIDSVNRGDKLQQIVAAVNSYLPDLVVITGDVVDGTVQQRGRDVAFLKHLHTKYGVYGVPGNHEYFSGYAEWMEFFRSINLQMLENTHCELPNGIYLAGITDRAARRRGLPMPDVEKSLQGIDKNAFTILLAHRPAYADTASKLGADLQLSGHTHGGMIYGLDKIVARLNDNFAAGSYKVNDMLLYVSSGTMIWSGFPFRLGSSSEITVITLKRKF